METRTVDDVVATHLTFDHMGVLIAERKSARQVGTTVTVKKLFSNLPVRSKEFHRNIRKEYGKLISLLNVSPFAFIYIFHGSLSSICFISENLSFPNHHFLFV